KGHFAYSDTSRRTDTSQAPMSMRASMIDESEHSATPQEAVNYLVDRVEDFANTALASPKFAEDESPNPTLTPRFEEAFRYALDLHRNQRRKGTNVPYISHLMAVAALVIEHGGDEDQAIAALLHDAQEQLKATRHDGIDGQPFGNQPDDSPVANPMLDESDQPVTADLVEKGLNVAIAEDQGGLATLQEIERRFGASVAEIVSDCTDAWTEPKPDWRARKEAYIAKLPTKPKRSLLVSLADKVHNAEAILFDHRILGNALWARFTGAAEGTRWYYGELAEFFV